VEFEWDTSKAATNVRKHGIPFELAVQVFADPARTEWRDDNLEEERLVTVGLVEGLELYVVYTVRAERVRLISARKATHDERKEYWNREV
jgi:hypothetical protein